MLDQGVNGEAQGQAARALTWPLSSDRSRGTYQVAGGLAARASCAYPLLVNTDIYVTFSLALGLFSDI